MESLRVLIVDDEPELVQALVERLDLRGITAVGVNSGAEALERLQTDAFDVLLLDVKMPGMSGLEVIREVKVLLPELGVVLLSGHSALESAAEGIRLGAFDYLIKPVQIDDLCKILRTAGGAECDDED
jgi:DNA-binding NtrC family response regulator